MTDRRPSTGHPATAHAAGVVLTGNPAAAGDLEDWQVKALESVKAGTDAREVYWSAVGSLWITAIDNGKDRNGTAAYACSLIMAAGAPAGRLTIIHVWETASMLAGSPKELGRYDCRT